MAKKLTHVKPSAKGSILTSKNNDNKGGILTNKNNLPFVVCFEYLLPKKFNFTQLQKTDIDTFQAFLDKISKMSFADVDKQYLRKPDKQDMFKDMHMIHYKASASFRIHGVIKNGKFYVIRLDPNHKVHN